MIPQIGSAASGLVIQRLTGSGGANANLASLTEGLPGIPALDPTQIRTGNIASDLAERSNYRELSGGQCLLRKDRE